MVTSLLLSNNTIPRRLDIDGNMNMDTNAVVQAQSRKIKLDALPAEVLGQILDQILEHVLEDLTSASRLRCLCRGSQSVILIKSVYTAECVLVSSYLRPSSSDTQSLVTSRLAKRKVLPEDNQVEDTARQNCEIGPNT